MDALSSTPIYIGESSRKGNGHGHDGNGHSRNGHSPFLITGRGIAALTNDGESHLDMAGAMLVRGEALFVQPTVPQVAGITIVPVQRIYDALHFTARERLSAVMKSGLITAKTITNGNGGMSRDELYQLVRGRLADVRDIISEITA
jgi:hypothetical protein